MIICWLLFGAVAITSAVCFIQVDTLSDQFIPSTSSDPSITPEILADLNRQAKFRHVSASPYYDLAHIAMAAAIGILLWNVIWHVGHWIIGTENGITNKIIENWRPLLVLATVVWAVFAYAVYGIRREDLSALVLGPFVIALAIYFLFPKRKNE